MLINWGINRNIIVGVPYLPRPFLEATLCFLYNRCLKSDVRKFTDHKFSYKISYQVSNYGFCKWDNLTPTSLQIRYINMQESTAVIVLIPSYTDTCYYKISKKYFSEGVLNIINCPQKCVQNIQALDSAEYIYDFGLTSRKQIRLLVFSVTQQNLQNL